MKKRLSDALASETQAPYFHYRDLLLPSMKFIYIACGINNLINDQCHRNR